MDDAKAELAKRTAAIEAELRALDAEAEQRANTAARRTQLQAEQSATQQLLKKLEGQRRLPLVAEDTHRLDDVRIASPCEADWKAMVGDERVRFCGKCEKNVYNLSAMSRAEAEQLMLEKEGELCVRLYQRKDGTVLTQDCPVGVRRKRLRLAGVLVMGAGLAGAAAAIYAGLRAEEPTAELNRPMLPRVPHPAVTDEPRMLMGAKVVRPIQGGMKRVPISPAVDPKDPLKNF